MWLPSLFSRYGTGRGPAARKRRGTRLGLEALENRLAPAVTLLVTGPGDAVAPDGVVTLREALLAANTNTTVNEAAHDGSGGTDRITFDTAGAFATPQTIPLGGTALTITDSVTITGPGADQLAVSGNHRSRVFSISGGATVAITGLTIRDGLSVGSDGGGILNVGSTLTLAHDVLSDNQARGAPNGPIQGGAVRNDAGASLTVVDCLFTHNQAIGGNGGSNGTAAGGGIFTGGGSTATVRDSTFLGNESIGGSDGGVGAFSRGVAIYKVTGTLTVHNSRFVDNRAVGG